MALGREGTLLQILPALYHAVIARHRRVTVGLAEETGFAPVLHVLE